MADMKISEMTSAAQVNETDNVELSQGSSGSFSSVKATILAIANKIVSGINFTSALQTTSKTITGAINEVAQGGGGGSSTLSGLSDVDIDTVTLDDGQGLVYDGTEGKWVNGSASGGGHTILDNSGTSLAQEPNLKFNGMYVHDDSANSTTVGEYYREMTQSAYDQLSAAEKQGLIRITDNDYVAGADEILYETDGQGNDVTVEDKLASIINGHKIKNDSGTTLAQKDNMKFGGVYSHNSSTMTEVDIVREFNSVADIEALTGESAKGFQYLDDDVYDSFTAGDIGFDNSDTSFVGTNVQDVLEEVDTKFNEQPLDISSSFVLNTADFSDLQGSCKVYYDEKTKRVWGTISAYSTTSTLGLTQAYFNISDSKYRPSSNVVFPMIVKTSGDAISFYSGTIVSAGGIRQNLSSATKGIYSTFEYYL